VSIGKWLAGRLGGWGGKREEERKRGRGHTTVKGKKTRGYCQPFSWVMGLYRTRKKEAEPTGDATDCSNLKRRKKVRTRRSRWRRWNNPSWGGELASVRGASKNCKRKGEKEFG